MTFLSSSVVWNIAVCDASVVTERVTRRSALIAAAEFDVRRARSLSALSTWHWSTYVAWSAWSVVRLSLRA